MAFPKTRYRFNSNNARAAANKANAATTTESGKAHSKPTKRQQKNSTISASQSAAAANSDISVLNQKTIELPQPFSAPDHTDARECEDTLSAASNAAHSRSSSSGWISDMQSTKKSKKKTSDTLALNSMLPNDYVVAPPVQFDEEVEDDTSSSSQVPTEFHSQTGASHFRSPTATSSLLSAEDNASSQNYFAMGGAGDLLSPSAELGEASGKSVPLTAAQSFHSELSEFSTIPTFRDENCSEEHETAERSLLKKNFTPREVLMLKSELVGGSQTFDTDAPIRTRCQIAKNVDRRNLHLPNEDELQPSSKRIKSSESNSDTSPGECTIEGEVFKECSNNNINASENNDRLLEKEQFQEEQPPQHPAVGADPSHDEGRNNWVEIHRHVKDEQPEQQMKKSKSSEENLEDNSMSERGPAAAEIQQPLNESSTTGTQAMLQSYLKGGSHQAGSMRVTDYSASQEDSEIYVKYPHIRGVNYTPATAVPVLSLAEMDYISHRISLLPDIRASKLANIYARYPSRNEELKESVAYEQFVNSLLNEELKREKDVVELQLEEQLFFEALKSQERGIHNLETAYLSVLSPYGRPVSELSGLFAFLEKNVTYNATEVAKYRNVNNERVFVPAVDVMKLPQLKEKVEKSEVALGEAEPAHLEEESVSEQHSTHEVGHGSDSGTQLRCTAAGTPLIYPDRTKFPTQVAPTPAVGKQLDNAYNGEGVQLINHGPQNVGYQLRVDGSVADQSQHEGHALMESNQALQDLCAPAPSTYANAFMKGGSSSNEYADLMATLERIPGVHYDKNNKMWLARIEDGSSPRHRRFSVSKFGFLEARMEAIATRNEYLQNKKHSFSAKDRATTVRTTYGASPTFMNPRIIQKAAKPEGIAAFNKPYPERQRKPVAMTNEHALDATADTPTDTPLVSETAEAVEPVTHGLNAASNTTVTPQVEVSRNFGKFRGTYSKYFKNKAKRKAEQGEYTKASKTEETDKHLLSRPNKYDPHFHSSFNPCIRIDEEFRLFSNSSVSAPTENGQSWREAMLSSLREAESQQMASIKEEITGEAGTSSSDMLNTDLNPLRESVAYPPVSGGIVAAPEVGEDPNYTTCAISKNGLPVFKSQTGTESTGERSATSQPPLLACPSSSSNGDEKRKQLLAALSKLMATPACKRPVNGVLSARQMLRNLLDGSLANGEKARSAEVLRSDVLNGKHSTCRNQKLLSLILQNKRFISAASPE